MSNKEIIFWAIASVTLVIVGLTLTLSSEPFVIEGDVVYIESAGKGKISQEPHTLKGFSNNPIVNFTSYFGTQQCFDFAFGFDTEQARPVSVDYYNPRYVNRSESFTCDCNECYFNYTLSPKYAWCWKTDDGVEYLTFAHSFESGNLTSKTIYWTEQDYVEWSNINDKFSKIKQTYFGKDTWYYIEDVNFQPGEQKSIRPEIHVKPSLGENYGKYDILIKRCSDTISQALSTGNYVHIDPWWNSSFTKCKNITITNGNDPLTDYQILVNVTYDSDMQADMDDLRFINTSCNGAGGSELDYWIEKKTDSSYADVWIEVDDIAASSEVISMYYGESTVSSNSDIQATAAYNIGDEFNVGQMNASMWGQFGSEALPYESGGYLIQNGTTGHSSLVMAYENHSVIVSSNSSLYGNVMVWQNQSDDTNRFRLGYDGAGGDNNVDSIAKKSGSTQVTSLDDWRGETMQRWEIIRYNGDNTTIILNMSETNTHSNTYSMAGGYAIGNFIAGSSGTDNVMWDWVFTRKFIYPEVTSSFGSEESEPAGSDSTVPKYQDITENTADPINYTQFPNYGFQINCTDETGMFNVQCEHNATGTLSNTTCTNNTSDIFYFNVTSAAAGVLGYKFYCNDTSGNVNSTDEQTFTVGKIEPELDIWLNTTLDSNKTYPYGSDYFLNTSGVSLDELYYETYRDGSEICPVDNPTTLYGCKGWNEGLGVGEYAIQINTTSSQNQSSSIKIYYYIVEKGLPVLTVSNGTNSINTTGLVGYWRFENDTLDYSGYRLDGIAAGYTYYHGEVTSATHSTGKYGQGYSFDGSDDLINMSTGQIISGYDSFTVMFWMNISDLDGGQRYIIQSRNTTDEFSIQIGTDNKMDIKTRGLTDTWWGNAYTPSNRTMFHFAFVYNSSHKELFIDGVSQGTEASTGTLNVTTGMFLGVGSIGNQYFYKGILDELRIWNTGLTSDEITSEMNSRYPVKSAGLISSYSFENDNSTHTFDTNHIQAGYMGGGSQFDGTDDYIELGESHEDFFQNGNQTTFSVWLNKLDMGTAKDGFVFSSRDDGDGAYSFWIDSLRIEPQVGKTVFNTETVVNVDQATWTHVVLTFDGDFNSTHGNVTVYKNSVPSSSAVYTFSNWNTTENCVIGFRTSGSAAAYFNGTIDELMVFNRTLVQSEIEILYRSSNHNYETSSIFNFTSNEAESAYNINRNYTSASAENDTSMVLPGGNHWYDFNTYGSSNYESIYFSVPIKINSKSPVLSLSGISNGTYPLSNNISAHSDDIDSITVTLEYNTTSFSNNTDPDLGGGIWNISAVTSGNSNYSSSIHTDWYSISKGPSQTNVYINGTNGNINVLNNTGVNVTVVVNISGVTAYMDGNMTGWSPSSNTTPYENNTEIVNSKWFNSKLNVTGYFEGNENYTSSSETYYMNITPLLPRFHDYYSLTTSSWNFSGFYVNITYPLGVSYEQIDTVFLEFNDTSGTITDGKNYTAGWNQSIPYNSTDEYWGPYVDRYNVTFYDLEPGTYNGVWYANDTDGEWNISEGFSYTLSGDGSSVTYGAGSSHPFGSEVQNQIDIPLLSGKLFDFSSLPPIAQDPIGWVVGFFAKGEILFITISIMGIFIYRIFKRPSGGFVENSEV